jgi:flagellar hook-associated protein 3 FlgL
MTAIQGVQQFQDGPTGNLGGQLTTAQQTFLQGAIAQLDGITTTTIANTAQGGAIQKRIDDAAKAQTDRQVTLKNMLGDITDVNMAQAASDLTQAQSAVQASAQVFMTLKGMSLLGLLTGTA